MENNTNDFFPINMLLISGYLLPTNEKEYSSFKKLNPVVLSSGRSFINPDDIISGKPFSKKSRKSGTIPLNQIDLSPQFRLVAAKKKKRK